MIIKLAIALVIVLIVAAFAAWAFLPVRYLPGNRARHLRIRLHVPLEEHLLVMARPAPTRRRSWPMSSCATPGPVIATSV